MLLAVWLPLHFGFPWLVERVDASFDRVWGAFVLAGAMWSFFLLLSALPFGYLLRRMGIVAEERRWSPVVALLSASGGLVLFLAGLVVLGVSFSEFSGDDLELSVGELSMGLFLGSLFLVLPFWAGSVGSFREVVRRLRSSVPSDSRGSSDGC